MNRTSDSPGDGISRRSLLAAGAVGSSLALSGCIDRVQSLVDQDADEQLSLSIMTMPADNDREGVQIARRLSENLEAVGIDSTVTMRSQSEFLEAILLDHDFDLYVGRHPGDVDPDFLYEALHSTYAYEAGWQNPFEFTSPRIDELLEHQRTVDEDARHEAVADLLEGVVVRQPFVPICIPDEYRVGRTDRSIDGWEDHLATRYGYLGTDPDEDVDDIHALITDSRPTQTLNPVSATVHERRTIIDLLYDSLGTVPVSADGDADGDGVTTATSSVEPWLAESWEWDDGTLTVDLREGVPFHDIDELDVDEDDSEIEAGEEIETENGNGSGNGIGNTTATGAATDSEIDTEDENETQDGSPTSDEPVGYVTASDVVFTYEFLADTTRGYGSLPAPQYRGHVSIVDDVTALDDYRVQIDVSTNRAVAERALTVPILPEHIWHERVRAEVNDRIEDEDEFSASADDWRLITTDNVSPVGSGPFRYADRSEGDSLTLERFDDHFTIGDDDLPEPTVDTLEFEVDPSSASSIERVRSGNADVAATMLESHTVHEIPEGDEAADEDVALLEDPSWTFYHVGFNTQRSPLGNPHFRLAVAQLLDKEWLVEDVFHGHARPVSVPVADEWAPDRLVWDGEDPETPFLGTDGELAADVAREVFADIGFGYDDDQRLLVE